MAEVIDLESPGLAAEVYNVGDRPKASRGAGCSAEEVCVVDDDDDDDVQPIKVLDEAPSSRRERARHRRLSSLGHACAGFFFSAVRGRRTASCDCSRERCDSWRCISRGARFA